MKNNKTARAKNSTLKTEERKEKFKIDDKKVRFSWQEPYNFLAAEADAAKNSTWSGTRDSNSRPHGPKPCALPTELVPEGLFIFYKIPLALQVYVLVHNLP